MGVPHFGCVLSPSPCPSAQFAGPGLPAGTPQTASLCLVCIRFDLHKQRCVVAHVLSLTFSSWLGVSEIHLGCCLCGLSCCSASTGHILPTHPTATNTSELGALTCPCQGSLNHCWDISGGGSLHGEWAQGSPPHISAEWLSQSACPQGARAIGCVGLGG